MRKQVALFYDGRIGGEAGRDFYARIGQEYVGVLLAVVDQFHLEAALIHARCFFEYGGVHVGIVYLPAEGEYGLRAAALKGEDVDGFHAAFLLEVERVGGRAHAVKINGDAFLFPFGFCDNGLFFPRTSPEGGKC
ncbi:MULTISPECIES: hypothetical protein [unclassified Parabacteroides]|uniref:hypothetical protein n=1 Tax=unclassified Parabacteroides TaxID=2649774 RepID=UPI002476F1CD|nr:MULTISPECIES: hypothetical protein [unclassified Parabacteroides]